MKTKFLFFCAVILAAISITGCLKTTAPTPVVLPEGNFAGTFTRYHYNTANGKIDTLTANITLIMSSATGFAVGGDTSHHAASHGGYVVDGVNIAFSDATLPSSTTNAPPPTKTHLNGVYQYSYTAGSALQLQSVGDTLIYQYNMKVK